MSSGRAVGAAVQAGARLRKLTDKGERLKAKVLTKIHSTHRHLHDHFRGENVKTPPKRARAGPGRARFSGIDLGHSRLPSALVPRGGSGAQRNSLFRILSRGAPTIFEQWPDF